MTMTLEQVRDWLLARAQDGQMQRSVYTSNYQLREMADAIDARLTQPAQLVDIEAIREVIESHINEAKKLRHDPESQDYLYEQASKLAAALQEKGNG